MQIAAPTKRQRGLSLVELLVSITIGLVLMIAVVSAYLGSSTASRVAEAQGRMNEDAQAALNILTQQLRMAGANPRQPDYATDTPRNPVFSAAGAAAVTGFALRGCDTNFANPALDMAALTCGTSGSDAVAVAYEADIYNTVKSSASPPVPTDCLGNDIPLTNAVGVKKWTGSAVAVASPQPTYRVAENKFYVADSAGIPSLFCKGNTGNAQPLVENVESMQIRYGMQNDPAVVTDLRLAGYRTATDVNTLTTLPLVNATNDLPTRWSKVVTVRVCIVVRSAIPVAPDTTSQQYYDCSGTPDTTKTDLRLRRAYTTTVVLRNRVS